MTGSNADKVKVALLQSRLTAQTCITALRQRLKDIDEALERMGSVTYIVEIQSSWSDCGEKEVEYQASSIELAIAGAKKEFMRVNNRSDVQGSGRVYIRLRGGDLLCLGDMSQFEVREAG